MKASFEDLYTGSIMAITSKPIKSCGKTLDASAERLGLLRSSEDLLGQPEALRARMLEDGYLLLRGFLNRDEVIKARLSVLQQLDREGQLEPNTPVEEAFAKKGLNVAFRGDIGNENKTVQELVYSEKVMNLFDILLEGTSMHYDYTWMRTMAPGNSTMPHYDVVYMGRGTKKMFTTWTPLSDIPFEQGGLMILENSHQLEDLKSTYGTLDVDAVCDNKEGVTMMESMGHALGFGALSDDPVQIADHFDRRWLTAEYQMGDLLIFTIHTLHGSTDNQTDRIRISTDTRYQLASEPTDERWIGENPMGHGQNAKKGLIC